MLVLLNKLPIYAVENASRSGHFFFSLHLYSMGCNKAVLRKKDDDENQIVTEEETFATIAGVRRN